MVKMSSCRLVLLMGVLILCDAPKVFGAEDSLRRPAPDKDIRGLVSGRLLKQAGLEILWENELPIKKGERLEKLFILGERIYTLSDRNYIISLDRQKGNIIFSRPIAPTGVPVGALELYEDELIFMMGSTLIEIDAKSGEERGTKRIEYGIECPVARNSSHFYLGGADRRLHVLREKDRVQVFEVAAENDSMITSIVADEDFVVFATDAGNVISMAPDEPRRLWQFDAGAAIAGPIVRDGMSLFFASKDTNVYRVDIVGPITRKLVWKQQMPGVLEKAPFVTEEVVYQYARGKGLTAIDKESGKLIWSLPEGVELLADADGKACVVTKGRTLVVMDNVEARKLYSVNFARVSRYAANAADSRIYIGDENGRVACLQPARQ